MRSKSANSSRSSARQRRAKPHRRLGGTAEGVETGRARPTGTFAERSHGQGTVRTTNAAPPHRDAAAAKAEVVRKSAARKGIRVRAPVIPLCATTVASPIRCRNTVPGSVTRSSSQPYNVIGALPGLGGTPSNKRKTAPRDAISIWVAPTGSEPSKWVLAGPWEYRRIRNSAVFAHSRPGASGPIRSEIDASVRRLLDRMGTRLVSVGPNPGSGRLLGGMLFNRYGVGQSANRSYGCYSGTAA